MRETDMVARFGGDEFAVLQDNVGDSNVIERLAGKIGNVVAAPYDLGGNQVSTSASIGIVPYRPDIANIDAMMMMADLALYRAKNDGRNRFRMHIEALDEQTRERVAMNGELRHAVERKELELYYQPQIDMASGSIVGLEALLRWNHPRRGQLLPDVFIPIAETTGSIVGIGEWVIGEACRQIARWRDNTITPPLVAVNLSGAQFKLAAHLDQIVIDNLARYDVAVRLPGARTH
jgi:predicted signal transduction protein with EAL and GGDEF domain